ncbi:urocanate hydratase [Defluviimonas sp. SAOS-178_SWC]|uniref:urocanate hydratase n=1 Tax=Defluviimonas sp. SAOS-178_SWC TaxID=3121287 RepID=UPI003221D500
MGKPEILFSVRAMGGNNLRCKGWKQETILRMLENNMENAEHPEELVIYGGIGKCARNWESYHAIVKSLQELENDETLVVQSGMPVAIFRTSTLAPRVVMATTNIMKATWPIFYDLQDKNLTIYAQYTAAPWEYIGTQGVIQGTFQTLVAIKDQKFDGSLKGRILLTAGMGGMGGNQTRAMTMLGGVCICADVDEKVMKHRLEVGYCDEICYDFDEAVAKAKAAAAEGRPLGIALFGNAVEVLRKAKETGFTPDIITDMTPAHDPLSYVPEGVTVEEARELRKSDRDRYFKLAGKAMIEHLTLMNEFHDRGVQVFEYGNSLRKEARDAGMPVDKAMQIPGFVAAYIRPLFCEGRGPFRWTCVSRDPEDLRKLDDVVEEMFADDDLVRDWIQLARKHIPIEGLPARICYLGFGQRKAFGMRVNEMVRNGELKGPVAFSRDNLDSGSIVNPTFESERMLDGSDLISDWPYLNALLNTAAGADLVAIQENYSMGEAVHTGVTMIADGSAEADVRLAACLTTDSGIGVVRHAQAGYDIARKAAAERFEKDGVQVPLWWTPTATFGPDDASAPRKKSK